MSHTTADYRPKDLGPHSLPCLYLEFSAKQFQICGDDAQERSGSHIPTSLPKHGMSHMHPERCHASSTCRVDFALPSELRKLR